MRLANVRGRAALIRSETTAVDVAALSDGRFGPDLPSVYEHWEDFSAWAPTADPGDPTPFGRADLGPPSPTPRQVFAIGLNYAGHAVESGFSLPESPPVFTKFPTSIDGPYVDVQLPAGGHTDWEVELVVVIGTRTRRAPAAEAWNHVAGVCVGQDLSERISQLAGPVPQFSLGKSFPGFSPIGPWLVTRDELPNPDDLELGCRVNGETRQTNRTSDLVFSVPRLVEHLSATLPLLPGDVIFTGTPAGVGLGMKPQVWLEDGDVLTSWIEGVGDIEQTFQSKNPV